MGVSISVVVPYFRQQEQLDLVLAALSRQTFPPELLDVVVADDGSPSAPRLGEHPFPVRLVRQEDRGFRAAAARNLGAASSSGDVLCFLDADTVPEPGYLAAMGAAVERSDGLVVGRRRHADLAGWSPSRLLGWLGGPGPAPTELEEPAWLREAYARTGDLADAGDDAYRFVISAVLALPRSLFDAVGGFEEAFDDYGGEDWELAHRCWLAGAPFHHERSAVAWHDGPDFAGRAGDALAAKNREALALARFVTDPAVRGRGLVWEFPDVVVRLDDRGALLAAVVRSVDSLLRDTDAAVWLRSGGAAAVLSDPRVHVGEPPPTVLARCRYQAFAAAPVELPGTLRDACRDAPAAGPSFRVERTRDLNRHGPSATPSPLTTTPLSDVDLGRTWGHAAKTST